MNNIRSYGKPPFETAVIHGGPGAAGELGPLARELSSIKGILEPLQTRNTIDGQVKELYEALCDFHKEPFILIGYSWGAWLSYIFAAYYPSMVRKLILINSAPFHDKYAVSIMQTRLKRLSDTDRYKAEMLLRKLEDSSEEDEILREFGRIIEKADTYDRAPETDDMDNERLNIDMKIYRSVWAEAEHLRKSGELLKLGHKINCPVTAIHGDFDPHPIEGVRQPLLSIFPNLKFIILERCGHRPWIERYARSNFINILRDEIG